MIAHGNWERSVNVLNCAGNQLEMLSLLRWAFTLTMCRGDNKASIKLAQATGERCHSRSPRHLKPLGAVVQDGEHGASG